MILIDYEYDKQAGILRVYYTGVIHVEDLIKYGRSISLDIAVPRKIKILTDGREVKLCLSQKDVPTLSEALQENLKRFDFVKAAYVYDRPRETALSLLLDHNVKNSNYEHKVFSTMEAAEFWLTLY